MTPRDYSKIIQFIGNIEGLSGDSFCRSEIKHRCDLILNTLNKINWIEARKRSTDILEVLLEQQRNFKDRTPSTIPVEEYNISLKELTLIIRDFLDVYWGGEAGEGTASKILDKPSILGK